MDYQLSDHAARRINKRGIKVEWVAAALMHPDTTENDAEDATLVHALKEIPEKGFRVLRVIYNETTQPVVVVTAFFE